MSWRGETESTGTWSDEGGMEWTCGVCGAAILASYRGRVRCRVRCCIKYSTLTRRSRVAARRHAQASRHSWGARSSQHSHTPLARARRVHAQASRHSWGARSSQHAQASRHSWGARSSQHSHTPLARAHGQASVRSRHSWGARSVCTTHTHTRRTRVHADTCKPPPSRAVYE